MTTAVYARVSTNKQDHRSQMVSLFDWLRAEGLSWREVRWFRDRGESSAKTRRPAFDRLMAAVRDGSVKRIVTYKLDRIGRWDEKTWLRWRLELCEHDIKLVSLLDPAAASFDDIGQQIISIVRAKGDSDWLANHSRRIRDGLRARKLRGERLGAAPRLAPERWAELVRRSKSERITDLAREYGFNHRYLGRKLQRERQKDESRATNVARPLRGGAGRDRGNIGAAPKARRSGG